MSNSLLPEFAGAAPTVREVTHGLLRELGMTTIFGNPGSTELPMFRDLPADFRYVLGLQESAVLAMADGYAQATHNAAVVSLHAAVGVGHAMGSLVTAFKGRAPLVIVAGQQARSMLGGEPYLFSDQPCELPRPYVKWSREPARPQDVPAAVARAYYLAMTPPCGPVLVSVPVDDWDQPAEPVAPRRVSRVIRADAELIADVGRTLASARHPAFVAGAAVDQEGAFADVVALAEAHQARVWAPPMSYRCAFPERHPLFAGFLPASRDGIVRALAGHDVVLVLGAPVFSYHVAAPGPYLPPGTTIIQLTDDPHTAAWTPVGNSVLTSIRPAVRELLRYLPLSPRAAPPARAVPAEITGPAEVTGPAAISQPFLMQTLAEVRPARSIIVEEAPSSRPVMWDYLPNEDPASFFTCASGGLGYSLPAAVGMALARPQDRVIAVIGDGAAMYSIQALWSAANLEVPLTIVVVNNGCYATLDRFARHFGIDKPVGTALPGLDFAGLARAQGCVASRVDAPELLAPALREALGSARPYLVDVIVG
jgi:benzoylformate decarboxylase